MSNKKKDLESLRDSRLLYEKEVPPFGYYLIVLVTVIILIVILWSMRNIKVDVIHAPGIIESDNKNYVMSPYTGEIVEINIFEGANVEKGETLFIVKSTELDLQRDQLQSQREVYEKQLLQYEKLVLSIKDGVNYFDYYEPDDSLYYNQYEAYQSQVQQNEFDTSTMHSYGYSDEEIENEVIKNQSKITEIYYTAIRSAEESIKQCQTQIDLLDIQLASVDTGQAEYAVTANATGKIHMNADYKQGMVVQGAVAIASIASEWDAYTIQATVDASDAARIEVGDNAEIAVSGLIESVYGTISGTVVGKDSDITIAQSDGNQNAYFKIEIDPDTTYLVNKRGDKVNISNGMSVDTRIQYDKVTYFEYILESLGVLTR